jgi:hypothetical protein
LEAPRPELRWPIGIAVALLIMMAVNACFIYVAITGADTVVPSYLEEDR